MDFSQSKKIWAQDNTRRCDRVILRRTFAIEKPPRAATLRFAASDTASVYVNGKPIALGVPHGEVEIGKHLVKGENVLGFECKYFGKPAKGYVPARTSGLVYACDALGLYSDAQTTTFRPFVPELLAEAAVPYAEFSSYTDGNRGELGGVMTAAYGSTLFVPAVEYGEAGEVPLSDVPLRVYTETLRIKKMERTSTGATHTYICALPKSYTFYPTIELNAMGTEAVEVHTEYTDTPRPWGEEGGVRGLRHMYICRNGIQTYACPSACRGSKLIITAPATVTLRNVEIAVTEPPVERALRYDGARVLVDIVHKCDNTMRACIDGKLLDNADRDRGSDLFALSVFARSAVWMYGKSILPSLRETISDASATEDGILRNDAGTPFAAENPIASLMFCSQWGAPAVYRAAGGDEQTYKALYARMRDYLLKWKYDGKLVLRDGGASDAGYNTDTLLTATCLYYSAVRTLLGATEEGEEGEKEQTLRRRADHIASSFASEFYRDGYFSSGSVCDERAVALAVLSGLAGEHAADCRAALLSCRNASPAYEGFVCEALGAIGAPDDACKRLAHRYLDFADGDSPVLGEYFFRAGSKCAAVATSPVSALVSGVFGIRATSPDSYEIVLPKPCAGLGGITAAAGNGNLGVTLHGEEWIVENTTGRPVTLRIGSRTESIGKGKTKIRST